MKKENVCYKELETVFTDVLIKVVRTISGFELTKVVPIESTSKFLCNHIVSQMMLIGEASCMLMVDTDIDSAKLITAHMTGIPTEQLSDTDIYDGMAEIVNVLAGNAKVEAREFNAFELSSPYTIVSDNLSVFIKRSVKTSCINFSGSNISLTMRLLYL